MGRADKVINFVCQLTHTSGLFAGQLFQLRDWQKDIIRDMYEPVNDQGFRIVRTTFLTMPRKNGKTELAAALVLYHLFGDGEVGAQVYSAAADKEQAALIFNVAAAMIRNDSELEQMLNIIESKKRIVHHESGSFYQALSSESKTKHGFSASAIIYDELAQAPNRELWDVLTTSTGARAQPMTMVISTMSVDRNSIMYELYDYACKVRDKVVDDETYLPIIYQAPENIDPWDEKEWYKCNPALGDFRSYDEMKMMATRAKRMPAAEATFKNLYLNQLVDSEQRFLTSTDWLAGKAEIDISNYHGRTCYGGLDLSSTTDLTCLALIFPMDNGEIHTFPFFWVPKDNIAERERKDRVPYPMWANQGLLGTPEGRAIDKKAIVLMIAEIAQNFNLQAMAYDRWRTEDLLKMLDDEGIKLNLVPWGQGYKDMSPAVETLEETVLNNKLKHNHPILDWNASNAVTTSDPAGSRKIAKDKATDRVDGIVSLVMALGLHSRMKKEPESVYASRGLLAI